MKQEAGPPLDIKSVCILTLTGLQNCEGCLFNPQCKVFLLQQLERRQAG